MLVSLTGFAERDMLGSPIHADQFRFVRGKINHGFSSTHDGDYLSLFFRDAKDARELARKINEVADSIEEASVAPAQAAE